MCAPHVDSTDAMDERSGSLFSLLCHQPGGCAGATGEGGGQGSPLSFCWSECGWPQFSLWFLATVESYFLNVSILPFPRPLTRESSLFFGCAVGVSGLLTSLAHGLGCAKQKEIQGSHHRVVLQVSRLLSGLPYSLHLSVLLHLSYI